MDAGQKAKEVLRLLDEMESLIPEIGRILSQCPGAPAKDVLARLESFHARAVRLREGTDCLPAAESGRKGAA